LDFLLRLPTAPAGQSESEVATAREASIAEALKRTLPAEPDSVPVARRSVAALASGLGMGEPTIGDLRLVVTEACANVVHHAYPAEDGSFEIEAFPEGADLAVVVRDYGTGIRPKPPACREDSLQMGLGLISQLSRRFEIGSGAEGGTVVRMHLPLL
jgi:serine/threonine-protein kinase RsbW